MLIEMCDLNASSHLFNRNRIVTVDTISILPPDPSLTCVYLLTYFLPQEDCHGMCKVW